MAIRDGILPEFENEMANTRRALERVPDGKLDWRPHPKSPTFAWLAGHVANLPGWGATTFQQKSFDIAPADGSQAGPPPPPQSRQELLDTFEKNVQAARDAISASSDEQMMEPWSLLKGGQALFTMPRVAVWRSMIMNHLIHHRAEVCVYLRLNDIAVPGLYGPSADEQ